MADVKVPYGFERQSKNFIEVSEGVYPRVSVEPAPYIPVNIHNNRAEVPIAMRAGTLVALDAWNQLVPANGGAAGTLNYSALDVDFVHAYSASDTDGAGDILETGDLPASFTLPANKLVGYLPYDAYINQRYYQQIYINHQVQLEKIAIGCDWFVEYPAVTDKQLTAQRGDLVVPDPDVPGAWMPLNDTAIGLISGTAYAWTASAAGIGRINENTFGKVFRVDQISDIDNLRRHHTMPGLNLTGYESSGVPQHLRAAIADANDRQGGGTSATYRIQIQVML
jgi:hypothetical protein